ncbi:MAG: 50S ribosomal protein L4 [bacterium]
MKVPVYNQQGKEAGQISLPKEIFEVKENQDLIYQVVVSQMANQRQVSAHTKNRGEVSGGGRKPWRQKGTGRARHGSTRSPIWRTGGVSFGPTNARVFAKKINKKMKVKALLMLLSLKAKEENITILESLAIEDRKTKLIKKIIEDLRPVLNKNKKEEKKAKKKKESILIILSGKNDNITRASRNIPGVKTVAAKDVNVLELISAENLIMPQESVKVLKERVAVK